VPGLPNPVGISNVMTNFGWEYVWHCHLLGHEENDMMRPLVLVIPPPNGAPTNLTRTGTTGNAPLAITLNWVDHATNENGFTIQRATNAAFTAGLKTITTMTANVATYVDNDTALLGRTRYYYRVAAWNQGGTSAWSNTVNFTTPVGPLPNAAPSGLATSAITRTSVVLSWTNNATNQTGVVIQRATNAGFTTAVTSTTVNTPTLTTRTMTGLRRNRTYFYRVAGHNAAGNGPWSNVVTFTTLP
jgi:fibronectin type 3 domain-containing protein